MTLCFLAPHCETKLLHLSPDQFNPALSCQGSICLVWTNFYGTGFSIGTHRYTWGTERIPLPGLHYAIFIANSSLETRLLLSKSWIECFPHFTFTPHLNSQGFHASPKPSLCESDLTTHSFTRASSLVRKWAEELVHVRVSIPCRTLQSVSLHSSYIGEFTIR